MPRAAVPKVDMPRAAVPKVDMPRAAVPKADTPKAPLMDNDFLRLEYPSIRQEILELKERVIKEFAIGLTGIPILLGTGFSSRYLILLLLSPIIVVAGYLMLLFEQNSIMRAGTYIGLIIEDNLLYKKSLGWEYWLEVKKEHRRAEWFFHLSAAIAFILYYVIGGCLAFWAAGQQEIPLEVRNFLPVVVGFFYGCVFGFAAYFIITNFKTHNELRECRGSNSKWE